jgi:hypothetical protein
MLPASVLLAAALALLATACSRPERTEVQSTKDCLSKLAATDSIDIRAALPTDSGMHGIWSPQAFKDVCSLEAWETRFIENRDIEASIKVGSFVPIYVHSDGTPLISVRLARSGTPATLASVEEQYLQKRSDEYLFVSQGMLAVSGIEYIGGLAPKATRIIPLQSGRWSVRVFELAAPRGPEGKASPDIPDFVVLVNPESSPTPKYRESVETFR